MDDSTTLQSRQCRKCGETKPLTTEFFTWREDRQIWDMPCKACKKAYLADYYIRNAEQLKQNARDYGATHKEEISERNKRRWRENPEESKERSKRQYWKNPEADKERSRRRREENPEKVKTEKRARYEQNKEEINTRERAKYAANPEPIRARNRASRLKNLEERRRKDREYARAYNAQNPEKSRARKNAWKHRNPNQRRAEKLRRRARIRNLPNTFTTQEWQRAVEYFGGRCAACGRQGKDLFGAHTLAGDHWIPLASPLCPGTTVLNIVPLCHGEDGCNSTKHAMMPDIWAERRFGKRKAKEVLARIQEYFDWVAIQ